MRSRSQRFWARSETASEAADVARCSGSMACSAACARLEAFPEECCDSSAAPKNIARNQHT